MKDLDNEALRSLKPGLLEIALMKDNVGRPDFERQTAALELREKVDLELNKRALNAANEVGSKKICLSSSPVAGTSTKYWHANCGKEGLHKLLINETISNFLCQKCGKPLSKWAEIT